MPLKMKPHCERCGTRLEADGEACICAEEHTYCVICATILQKACPTCHGEIVRRPRAVVRQGASHPAIEVLPHPQEREIAPRFREEEALRRRVINNGKG